MKNMANARLRRRESERMKISKTNEDELSTLLIFFLYDSTGRHQDFINCLLDAINLKAVQATLNN